MAHVNATELAATLNVTKARVSQYVSEGKLSGCFTGEGRARRFDLVACAKALGRHLDKGQMMGNGAETRKAIADLASDAVSGNRPAPVPSPPARRSDVEMPPNDPDRYELARTQKAEEEARRLRRQNAEAEGSYALVSEVNRQVAQQMAQEIGEFEAVLRDGARQVADVLGVDFKTVRQILTDRWRGHRATRAAQLSAQAETMALSLAERAEDI
jgi:plasmid maintenance system antidote protein VapI